MGAGWVEIVSGLTRGLLAVKRSEALRTSADWSAFGSSLETMDAYIRNSSLVRTGNWRDITLIALDSPQGQAFHAAVAAAVLANEPSLAPGQAFDIAVIRYAEMPSEVRRRAEQVYRQNGHEGIEAVVASLYLTDGSASGPSGA